MSEPEVQQALEDLAGQVPARDLTAGAWRRGRRRRRWRSGAIAAAMVVLIVAAAALIPPQLDGTGSPPVAARHGQHNGGQNNQGNDMPEQDKNAQDSQGLARGPYATWHRDDNSVMKALGGGKLVLEDGCFYLSASDGRRTIQIFPDVARWDPDTQTITLDGQTYGIGDDVRVGGGFARASYADHIPETCHRNKKGASFWQVSSFSAPFATWYRKGPDTDTQIDGRLVLDHECLYLEQNSGERHPVILPDRTRWNAPEQTLTLNEKTIHVGDRVTLHGSTAHTGDANFIPGGCPLRKGTRYWQVGEF